MAEIKTTITEDDVLTFIHSIENDSKRNDSLKLLDIFKKVTKLEPKLWSNSVIGFGQYHYKSDKSSQEGDWFLTGFSPRKSNLSIYIMHGQEQNQEMLDKLGKYKSGVGCMYINKLSDVNIKILEDLISKSFEFMRNKA